MSPSRRSESSRRNLIAAAGRLVSERGLGAVRIREIADSAGLSPAAVLYHYPDNADLMLAVHREAVGRYVSVRSDAQAQSGDPRQRLVATVMAGVPPYADDAVIRLLFEMHGLARRSPAHADLMTGLWQQEADLYAAVLSAGEAAGLFTLEAPVGDVAATLLALEDGLVLHLVSNNSTLDAARVVELFLAAAAAELRCPSLISICSGRGPR